MPTAYLEADATQPTATGPKILVHVCNDIGAWGRGFVLGLSQRYPEPERRYKAWAAGLEDLPFKLGQVQFVPVLPHLTVANLIGQHDIARKGRAQHTPPVRYTAIREGLGWVRSKVQEQRASVHMPRIRAGLAGGDWAIIETIIDEELTAHGLNVTVYDFSQTRTP